MVIYAYADGMQEKSDMIDFLSFRGRSIWEAAVIPHISVA